MTRDAVLSAQTFVSDDHITADLPLDGTLEGRYEGPVSYSRASTATYVDIDTGLVKTAPVDVPRFERFGAQLEHVGLLHEDSGTNLLLWSEEFDNAAWGKVGSSIAADVITAPDGNATADKLTEDGALSAHSTQQTFTPAAGTSYAYSVFYKGNERHLKLQFPGGFDPASSVIIDTSSNTVFSVSAGATATIEAYPDGWYRVRFVATSGAAPSAINVQTILRETTGGTDTYQGDGLSGLYIWGAQLEEHPYATSYIPTTSTTASRSQDTLSIPFDGNHPPLVPVGQSFSYAVTADRLGAPDSGTNRAIIGEIGAGFNFSLLRNNGNSPDALTYYRDGSGIGTQTLPAIADGESFDIIVTVAGNFTSIYKDGALGQQRTQIPTLSTANPTSLGIGRGDAGSRWEGHIANFKIYDTALTAEQVADPALIPTYGSAEYDLSIGPDGDIVTEDFFDTAILYSLFGERRASPDEMVEPQRRRGWIGNAAFTPAFENGSKLWLLEQERITRSVLNAIQDEAGKALQWLVDDGFAVSIDSPVARYQSGRVTLEVTIRRSRDKVSRRFYTLWENTGRAS